MPFVSKRQQRWMFANKPEMARRWAAHTPDLKALPERAAHEPEDAKTASLLYAFLAADHEAGLWEPRR